MKGVGAVGNKMHKAFPLLVRKFPLPEGTSHCLKKNATARRKVMPLLKDCTAVIVKKKLSVKDEGFLKISAPDSYEAPENNPSTTTTSTTSGEKSGRTVTLTTEDMLKKKNHVKARTTLLLSLPDEYQLRFSKHKTARELWDAILKTFGGNEATKKTKKNLLKQKYGNIRVEGSEMLEQTFTRLQVIVALARVESRLVEYKEREVKYIEKIKTLKYYDKGKMECIESLRKELESLKQEKEVVDGKLAGLLTASKDLDNLIEIQRSDKSKEGLGYTAVPPPTGQLYLSPKKDLSWTGLPECTDDTVTDYSRPSPIVKGSSE
nr:ribonuclease H-like domain-containing protein [Tanacetum cinerariifolium]